jgi:hypothetical protein
MEAEQVAHDAPASAVPQLEQNFPDAAAPQVGQVAEDAGEADGIGAAGVVMLKTTWW